MGKKGSMDLSSAENGNANPGFEGDDGKISTIPDGDGKSNPPGFIGFGAPTETLDPPIESTVATTADGGAQREQWDRPIEFLFSCIAMSVGLGNVWRFPMTAYENGGGVFLIPYLIVLTLIGRPMYFMEMALGQFSSYGQIKVWKLAPFFKGVGYGSAVGTAAVLSYYCSIMAITIFYFGASFNAILPWDDCDKPWGHDNMSVCSADTAQRYYSEEVFIQKENILDGIGYPEWRLTLCLAGVWVIICATLIKGVKSSGKVAYFTALFPYVVLLILLVRGLTLDGAIDGIKFFLEPDWGKLLEPKVWYEAVSQMFFSLSTGFGPIFMFSSYNPYKHNVYRDAWVISLTDTLTSLLAGFTIFAVLGNLAFISGKDISEVVDGGPGLAFVSYPAAIAKFDVVPQFFAVLFFLMLFTLGVGSASALAGGLITIICDQWPSLKRWMVTVAVSIAGLSIGLIYVTPGGQFMLTLVDEFGAKFVIYVMAMIEVGAIAWVYGLSNISADIEHMLGIKIGIYWKFCWGLFIPIFLLVILVYHMVENFNAAHNKIPFEGAALICGWMLAVFALALLPGMALHAVMTRKSGTLLDKLKESLRPAKDWGPLDPAIRQDWKNFKKQRGLDNN